MKRCLKFRREKSIVATYIHIYVQGQVGEGKPNADNIDVCVSAHR